MPQNGRHSSHVPLGSSFLLACVVFHEDGAESRASGRSDTGRGRSEETERADDRGRAREEDAVGVRGDEAPGRVRGGGVEPGGF